MTVKKSIKITESQYNRLKETLIKENNGYDWDSLDNMSQEEREEASRKYHEKIRPWTPEADKEYRKANESDKELTEIDYGDVYSKVDPWDKQSIKIDDYPAEGKNLDWTLKSADIALNSNDFKEKKEQRHRFLMDDNQLREYLNKLKKIKVALDKNVAGEQLDDFERKIVRYYKSNKKEQKARISNAAGKKLDSNFVDNFDKSQFSEYKNKAIEIFSRKDRSKSEVFITDINPEVYQDGVRFRVNCKLKGEDAEFLIYQDGSNGFVGNSDLNPYVITDSGFKILVMNIINGIRPQTKY